MTSRDQIKPIMLRENLGGEVTDFVSGNMHQHLLRLGRVTVE